MLTETENETVMKSIIIENMVFNFGKKNCEMQWECEWKLVSCKEKKQGWL